MSGELRKVLEVSGVAMTFGGVSALDNVSLSVSKGEVLGIVGPNGAGKTTLFSVIAGFLRQTRGEVRAFGRDIARLGPHERCRLGMQRTWQTPRVFPSMTVRENILAASVADRRSVQAARPAVDAVLEELGLDQWEGHLAADIPPGQKKRLELARALVRQPRILLLDEGMAGQTATEVEILFDALRMRVLNDGLTVIMIEHVLRAVRSLCDRVVVLASGTVLAEGAPAHVMELPEVREAYMGTARP